MTERVPKGTPLGVPHAHVCRCAGVRQRRRQDGRSAPASEQGSGGGTRVQRKRVGNCLVATSKAIKTLSQADQLSGLGTRVLP